MAMVDGDWSVTQATKVIDYIGDDHLRFGGTTPSYATVAEFHKWLQDKSDDPTWTGNDELQISTLNPSSRSTDQIITLINGYTLTAAAAEHLYAGSIIQASDDSIWDGIVNYGNSDVTIQIIQDGAVITDDWWNLTGGGGLNADANNGISHQFMLKVRDAGTDTDGRRLLGTTRKFGNTYSEFRINGTTRGVNVLALVDADDGNNNTAEGTVATWDQFTNANEGYQPLDVNNDGSNEFYYSYWQIGGGATPASPTINDLYEYTKWLTRDGSGSTVYGLSGELFRGITHQIAITSPTGTFVEPEGVSWTGGTGQLLAIDSTTAGTTMWIQVLSGVAPTDAQVITGVSTATATVNTTVTPRTISTPFIGGSTGTAISPGAYGLGIDPTDLTQNDLLRALDNSQYQPPNFVTGSVGGLVSGEDRVLVGPWDGSSTDPNGDPAFDFADLVLNTTLSGAAESQVVVTTAIPGETPNTGWLRIELDDGEYVPVEYSSWDTSTFTLNGTYDFAGGTYTTATAGVDVMRAPIDKTAGAATETFTGVYSGDTQWVALVRDGGGTPIKQSIQTFTLGSGGGGVTAIRTSDA